MDHEDTQRSQVSLDEPPDRMMKIQGLTVLVLVFLNILAVCGRELLPLGF